MDRESKRPTDAAFNTQIDELVDALRSVQEMLNLSHRQISGLLAALESLPQPATAQVPGGQRVSINWVIGPPDNIGWAYGNNAKRLAGELGGYAHSVSSDQMHDIAVYFDLKVATRFPVPSRYSVLRIGGPRPLDDLCGSDVEALRAALAPFDAVIALSGELKLRAMQVHPNVHLIANALPLADWKSHKPRTDREFTFGFASSLKSASEANVKGYDLAKSIADHFGAPLLMASKGKSQIPHDRMLRDFYGKIDCLLHPVAPGREGTSNVVMEALAAGIPVLTTPHAGFHGEFLVHRRTALVCERDAGEMITAVSELISNPDLRRRLSREGRAFAERNHDLAKAAVAYEAVFAELFRKDKAASPPPPRRISFVPFWQPIQNYGSSRLRAQYPAEYISRLGTYDIVHGYDPTADVVVVVQSCSNEILEQLLAHPDQFVIYDVCDKYYENGRIFRHLDPPVDSMARFHELCARADLVTVPTRELKAEIASRMPDRAVHYIPEPIDYGGPARRLQHKADKVVLWFGNPDRGNFESAKWMLDHLRSAYGFTPLIVSRESFFKRYPDYAPFVVPWSLDAMNEAFAKASLCVVGYHLDEQAKSPNRFVSAIMQGVPTLAHGSPAVRDILRQSGHEFADITDVRSLDRALGKLGRPDFQKLFMKRLQARLIESFGEKAIASRYHDMLDGKTWHKAIYQQPRRVGFISHNLALGEGAPWSLFELVNGLRNAGCIDPFVFCSGSGPLAEVYREAKIPVTIAGDALTHSVKALNSNFSDVRKAFLAFLKENRIEAVVGNTVKAAPFIDLARAEGLKAAMIVRESYASSERFSHFKGDARLLALDGVTEVEEVIFVANTSRQIWEDQPFRGNVTVIPNGVSPDRFSSRPGSAAATLRADLGFASDEVVAVCVGTVNLRKGQGELVEAFSQLPDAVRTRSRLVFVGAVENSHLNGFLAQIEALPENVRSRITVVETVEDVAPYYLSADLFLMNSSSEAYPRSVVEALYFGLPVLSTPVFGVKEQIEEGISGFLYDFNSMDDWRTAFERLVTDPALRSRVSREASRAFWKLTGYQEMLQAYKAILSRILPSYP